MQYSSIDGGGVCDVSILSVFCLVVFLFVILGVVGLLYFWMFKKLDLLATSLIVSRCDNATYGKLGNSLKQISSRGIKPTINKSIKGKM